MTNQAKPPPISGDAIPRGKRTAFQTVTLFAGLAIAFLTGEILLRAAHVFNHRSGTSLQELLERSRQSSPDEAKGEVSLRGLIQPSAHSNIVYEAKPGLTGLFRNRPFAINRHGQRGPERSLAKPPGVYRIVGLGDSVMFGWGVGQDEFYLAVLERELNRMPQPRPTFETLNYALPGYNTTMEVAMFEDKAMAFDPDMVVIQFVNNDFGVPNFMLREPEPWTLRRSFFVNWILRRARRIAEDDPAGLVGSNLEGLGATEREAVLDQYRHMTGPSGYRRAMSRLAALTKPRGIPVILLRGSFSKEQGDLMDRLAEAHGFHVLDIRPHTLRVLTEMGVPDDPEARKKLLWVGKSDHHPNALGHEIYAKGLMQTMTDLGIIRPPAQSSPLPPCPPATAPVALH